MRPASTTEIFPSLYVRDPAGVLLEYATDALALPWTRAAGDLLTRPCSSRPMTRPAPDLRVICRNSPCRARKGTPMRDLHFMHRFTARDPGRQHHRPAARHRRQ